MLYVQRDGSTRSTRLKLSAHKATPCYGRKLGWARGGTCVHFHERGYQFIVDGVKIPTPSTHVERLQARTAHPSFVVLRTALTIVVRHVGAHPPGSF